jgi:hypothetical protein
VNIKHPDRFAFSGGSFQASFQFFLLQVCVAETDTAINIIAGNTAFFAYVSSIKSKVVFAGCARRHHFIDDGRAVYPSYAAFYKGAFGGH